MINFADRKAMKKMSQKKNKKTVSPEKPGLSVYLGPSIRGVIQSGTIFNGTKAEMIAFYSAQIEKYPLIRTLIVTDKTLAEDRIRVKTPGNALYVNYHKLLSGRK